MVGINIMGTVDDDPSHSLVGEASVQHLDWRFEAWASRG